MIFDNKGKTDFMMGGAFVTMIVRKLNQKDFVKKGLTQKLKSDILIFVGASL